MISFLKNTRIHKALIIIMLFSGLMGNYAQAGMVSTDSMINAGTDNYSQQDLQTAMASEELRAQLEDMGVDTSQLNDRLASLTSAEIIHLNAELEQQPAGGIVGVLLTIFVVFIVTDMLCATDVFSFVKCINK